MDDIQTYPSDRQHPSAYGSGWEARRAGQPCEPPHSRNTELYWAWLSGWVDCDAELNGER